MNGNGLTDVFLRSLIPPEENLAYIAGFIDGEGCLHIGKRKSGGIHKTNGYFIKITISNTNLSILEWIKSIYGGHIQKIKKGGKCKDGYQLHFNTQCAINLLDDIQPYLRIKIEQANILREFSELRKVFPKRSLITGQGSLPSSSEYLGLQEKCYQKNKELNKRGSS